MMEWDFAKFRKAREKLGIRRVELAEELMVSLRTVERWENGQSKPHKVHQPKLQRIVERAQQIENTS